MTRWSVFLLLVVSLISQDSLARRRHREVPITGKIVIKGKARQGPDVRGAFWKFSDPFATSNGKGGNPAYQDLVVVIFKTIGGKETSPKITVEGMEFVPHTKVLNYVQDLEVENSMDQDITVYSPGRVRDRRDLEPLMVPAGGSAVFTVGPSDDEASDRSVLFWAFPLRLKGYPFARGWAVFVRSNYFSSVGPDGSFKLPPLPPGKYDINFIYRGRLLKFHKEVEIKKRRRKPLKLTIELTLEGE